MFLTQLREKHLVDDAISLVDSALWPQAALHRHGLDDRYEKHGNRNSVERVFRNEQVKQTSSQIVLVTLEKTLSKIDFKHSASYEIS